VAANLIASIGAGEYSSESGETMTSGALLVLDSRIQDIQNEVSALDAVRPG
jgi:hypothetical protein